MHLVHKQKKKKKKKCCAVIFFLQLNCSTLFYRWAGPGVYVCVCVCVCVCSGPGGRHWTSGFRVHFRVTLTPLYISTLSPPDHSSTCDDFLKAKWRQCEVEEEEEEGEEEEEEGDGVKCNDKLEDTGGRRQEEKEEEVGVHTQPHGDTVEEQPRCGGVVSRRREGTKTPQWAGDRGRLVLTSESGSAAGPTLTVLLRRFGICGSEQLQLTAA